MQGSADLLGGGETQVADLVERRDLGRAGRAFGHHQRPDRFHVAVAGLGLPQLAVPLGGVGRLDGVHGVGLALAAALLAVGAVYLHHLHPGPAQVAGQAGPVAAGALHPDPRHRAEAGQPNQQLPVTSRGWSETRSTPRQPTDPVQRGGHVHIQMRVHTTSNRARGIYSCHGHPFLSELGSGWHTPPACGDGVIVLLAQGDPPRSASRPHPSLVDQLRLLRQADRQPISSQTKPRQTDRTPPPNNEWWISDQPHLHTPCRVGGTVEGVCWVPVRTLASTRTRPASAMADSVAAAERAAIWS